MISKISPSLTFDDVLLQPQYSDCLPNEVDTSTHITKSIKLRIPLISAAMDTVTNSTLAITIAQLGGIGCLYKNSSIEKQVKEVNKVKNHESYMITSPIIIHSDEPLDQAIYLMEKHSISGIPVIDKETSKLEGIITTRDIRFSRNKLTQPVKNFMSHENLITVTKGTDPSVIKDLLHKHRLEKIIVVDNDNKCKGLVTFKDMNKINQFPFASKDKKQRLLVAAAVGTAEKDKERVLALLKAEVDILVIDTAHAHSKAVIEMLKYIKQNSKIEVIVGNIATAEAAKDLIKYGADAVKVGIGPGSICTTRVVAGVGVPQLSAIMNVAAVCKNTNTKVIADGGIRYSGDIAKAIAAGADVVMIGSLFAGTEESPGEFMLYKGASYKYYRGMGSTAAMSEGSADRYFQQDIIKNKIKLIAEGVESRVPFKGKLNSVVYQLIGGLKAAMGYTGNNNIEKMKDNCNFVQITSSGLRESHVHNVLEMN